MIGRAARTFRGDESGAISPLYAVAILTLVAMAGIGFDYGRVMALDTELQNAADQAALAAATQLDGREGAMQRARDAANDTFATATSQFVNQTRFANDGSGRPITSLSFRFYEDYEDDAPVDEVIDDDDGETAQVVEVTVNPRQLNYALTPLVGAIRDDAIGRAMATLQDSTCNVPPMMFCSPNRSFPGAGDAGKGIPLHMKKNQTGSQTDAENPLWAPGNFGFLDIEYDLHGNPNRTLGVNTSSSGCFNEAVESRTGFRTTEAKALNTRFDIYEAPLNNCNSSNGDFCPAEDVRKNWVRVESHNNVQAADIAGLACSSSGSGDWIAVDEIPTGENPPADPGFPCDSEGCTSFGTGNWGAQAWLTLQHPGTLLSDIPDLDGNGSISRYEVYEWEQDPDFPARLDPKLLGNYSELRPNGRYDVKLYCSYPRPIDETPYTSATAQKDRRLLTVAAVDCTGLTGHGAVDILRWVDIFLVTPADRTTGTDDEASGRAFYAEVVGPATLADGGSGFQYYSRRKAVLIR
jgi:Flp pilus assembly protein TadG